MIKLHFTRQEMFRGERQHIEFIGNDVLVIKNQKLTNYLAIKIDNITSIQLEKQNIKEIKITTMVMIWSGLLLSVVYGLGLPLFFYALYKHYRLDREYLLRVNERGEQQPYEINLPQMKNVLDKIAIIMSDIEVPAKPLGFN